MYIMVVGEMLVISGMFVKSNDASVTDHANIKQVFRRSLFHPGTILGQTQCLGTS